MSTPTTIFKWPIDEFSRVAARDGPVKTLKSKNFTVNGTETNFYLSLYPNGYKEEDKNYLSLFLFPLKLDGPPKITLAFVLWLENNRGQRIESKIITHLFEKNVQACGYPKFAHHNKVYSPDNGFVKDDFLFACCQVRPIIEYSGLTAEFDKKLRMSLFSVYEKGVDEKCTIELEGEELTVSKSILMAHSIVFERMLQANMDESKSGTIKIEDTSIDAVKGFVKYLHLGEVSDLDKLGRELFVLADKYDVQQLADLCAESIAKSLSKNNVFDYLKLAFMHANQTLKDRLLDFVTIPKSPGNFRQILKSPEWNNLQTENAKLAEEIMDAVFDHTCYL